MGAMVGLVMAQDLMLIFLFWDLTAIASYYLISYDRQKAEARSSALMALLVTGISAVFMLIGFLFLRAMYGTFSLPEIIAAATPSNRLTVALALIAGGALVKSAQMPFHFWLPRAMAAPTPVSAYLHSAAMVAAGVFLIGRFYPLMVLSRALLDALLVVGLVSMIVASLLALTRDRLKPLLAYSTIAQYGYVVVMLSLGTGAGVVGATFYVLAHALAKSGLFLTAGTVTEATGEDALNKLGGLARQLPTLAIASGIAAAGLGALPLTIGFFKDELFFAAALERGPLFGGLAVIGASLTLSYVWHFWSSIFLGATARRSSRPAAGARRPDRGPRRCSSWSGGIIVAPAYEIAAAAGKVSFAALVRQDPGVPFRHATREPDGAGDLRPRRGNHRHAALVADGGGGDRGAWPTRSGQSGFYRNGLAALNHLSRVMVAAEIRDLRGRIATVLIPAGLLVAAGFAATPTEGAYRIGAIGWNDLPLIVSLLLVMIAAITTTVPRSHLTMVLALSSVGYSLAATFSFFGAPNVAMIMALVETILTILVLGVLSLFPAGRPQTGADPPGAALTPHARSAGWGARRVSSPSPSPGAPSRNPRSPARWRATSFC